MLKRVLIPTVVFLAGASIYSNIKLFAATLKKPTIYHKDFLNHFVLGRAALSGIDPYTQISALASQFIGSVGEVFPHPSPYPPPNVLIFIPLGALTYEHAVWTWHLVQLASLLTVAFLLARQLGSRRPIVCALAVALVAFAWNPVAEDFVWGNSMLVLLVPLLLSWRCLREHRDWCGGLLLGLVIALKFIALPIFFFLVLRKRWKAVLGAVMSVVIGNALAIALIGIERAVYYYTKVPGIVAPLYQARVDNFSIYGVGWRFFEGTGSPVFESFRAQPLFYAPRLAYAVAVVLPLLALIVTIVFALRARSFDQSFALLLCACVVIGPLSWRAYMVWLALPLALVIPQLSVLQTWSARLFAMLVALLLFGYPTPLSLLAGSLVREGEALAPFLASLLTYIPLAAVCGLFTLLVYLDRDGAASLSATRNEYRFPRASVRLTPKGVR